MKFFSKFAILLVKYFFLVYKFNININKAFKHKIIIKLFSTSIIKLNKMGQKCSCLYSKDGEAHTYFFKPQQGETTETSFIANEKFSRAANKKLNPIEENLKENEHTMLSEKITNQHSEAKNNTKESEKDTPKDNQPSEQHLKLLQRFQAIVRGAINRKYYKINVKSSLQEECKKMIAICKENYTSHNLARAESKFPTFNPNGWTKFYQDESKFKINYGFVFDVKLLKCDEWFYQGQVNLKGEKHGIGEMVTTNGVKYIGTWYKNVFVGWGRCIDGQGNLNEGRRLF